MRRNRATKIIATLGPASSSADKIERLFLAGVDVFRLNFSHGTWAEHQARADCIRQISRAYGCPIGVMQDLQGPKLRIGRFGLGRIDLRIGQIFTFDLNPCLGDEARVSLLHPEIFAVLRPGMELLLDDGRLKVMVLEVTKHQILTQVVVGGELSDHKGVNVPDVRLPISALTAKDRQDLEIGCALEADYVALSFVQTPDDIHELRQLLTFPAKIIAKLEKPAALEQLDAIIAATDAVMVARGDLGVEMPPEEVPRLQRQIIRACRAQARPVIVATQMLDSMVQRPTPTRAEASDVASAVYDGVDAVMLSAESASGQYPRESVSMMDKIIKTVESDPFYRETLEKNRPDDVTNPGNAIAGAARHVAHMIGAKAIVTLTEGGGTTLRAAYERPTVPVVAFTPNHMTAQQLNLVWGVHPYVVERFVKTELLLKEADRILRSDQYAGDADHVVVTSGSLKVRLEEGGMFKSGTTRVLRIMTLGDDL